MINTNHVPVMANELIKLLNIKEDGFYMDLTFGGGGHSKEILNNLSSNGKLVALDLYSGCETIAKEIMSKNSNFIFSLDNYINYFEYIKKEKQCDGFILDLGFSSDTLDLQRGFSYMKKNEPLDMRYSLKNSNTARRILSKLSRRDLLNRFKELEVYNAEKIVDEIINYKRTVGEIELTGDLIKIIESVSDNNLVLNKTLKTLFQALRIIVNDELENLRKVLTSFKKWINNDGRFAILCFNSLERKLVMREFKKLINPLPADFPIDIPSEFELVTKKPMLPSDEEKKMNSRSKSACLIVIRRKYER